MEVGPEDNPETCCLPKASSFVKRRDKVYQADMQERLRAVMLRPVHSDKRHELSGVDVYL